MKNDNTNPDFFNDWTKEQLEVECARLNRLIKDLQGDIDSIIRDLKKSQAE